MMKKKNQHQEKANSVKVLTKTKMNVLVKAACLGEVVNHAAEAMTETVAVMMAAAAVNISKRSAAHWMIFAIKFAISRIAKCNKMLALPLSRAEFKPTKTSLIFYKLM